MSITLSLSPDEALVLFELASRLGKQSSLFEDQAEQRALWNLEASLESVLEAPFAPDYSARLEAARTRLRDSSD